MGWQNRDGAQPPAAFFEGDFMPNAVRRTFAAWLPWLLLLAMLVSIPACATNRDPSRSSAADDLDSARSDFDRHTPPGGD